MCFSLVKMYVCTQQIIVDYKIQLTSCKHQLQFICIRVFNKDNRQ